MNNQLMVIAAVKGAIEHLRQSHSNVAMSLLEGIQQDLERHLANSARYELFRTACIDKSSFEHVIMLIVEEPQFGDAPEEVDAIFDKAMVSVQAFKDAQEAIK